MSTLATRFSGFAGKALNELVHPVESIKRHWKTEMDRIAYWATVGDNVALRSGLMSYADGVAKTITSAVATTAMVNPVWAAGLMSSFGIDLIVAPVFSVCVGISHFFREGIADSILTKRAAKKVLDGQKYTFQDASAREDDATHRHDMQGHLIGAVKFAEIMDLAGQFGYTKKIFAMANQQQPLSSSFVARKTYGEKNELSVAVRNLQGKADLSMKDLERAALSIELVKNPVLREKYLNNLCQHTEDIAQKCMIIPSREDARKSLGELFMELSASFRQQIAPTVAIPQVPSVVAQQPSTGIVQEAEISAQKMAAFAALPQVQKSRQDADLYGVPRERTLNALLGHDPVLAKQYATMLNDTLHTPLKVANAAAIGLIAPDTQAERQVLESLRAMRESSRDWPMSVAFSMVNNLLENWQQVAQQKNNVGNLPQIPENAQAANNVNELTRPAARRMRP